MLTSEMFKFAQTPVCERAYLSLTYDPTVHNLPIGGAEDRLLRGAQPLRHWRSRKGPARMPADERVLMTAQGSRSTGEAPPGSASAAGSGARTGYLAKLTMIAPTNVHGS